MNGIMAIELSQFDIEYRPRTAIKEISINQEAGILYKVNCSKEKPQKQTGHPRRPVALNYK